MLAWAGPFLRASFLPALLGLVVAGGLGVTWYAFRYHELLVDGVYVAGALAVLLFWLAMARYVREEARRRTIRNAFSRYLSPVMVDRLTSSARALKMGGERRELTVLFSDIRGFTTLSERYEDDPEGLTALLSRYFTAMTAIIQENSGTIDKYIGDAIMAFWNAPLPVERHPRARPASPPCGCARGCVELNEALARRGRRARRRGRADPDRHRPQHRRLLRRQHGLGAALQLLGDRRPGERGLARSRAAARATALDIVIGETTRQAAADLAALEIDRVRLAGQDHGHAPVRAGRRRGGRPQRAVRRAGRRARRACSRPIAAGTGTTADAEAAPLPLISARATASPTSTRCYGLRIALYMTDPPPPDWDGSEIATSKD